MPYITEERKERIEIPHVLNVGELTYVIDRMAEELAWQMAGYDFDKLRYESLASVRGAINNAADEFYRRVIAPFEDGKIAKNGDIFVYPHREQWEIEELELPEPAPLHLVTDEPAEGQAGRAWPVMIGIAACWIATAWFGLSTGPWI